MRDRGMFGRIYYAIEEHIASDLLVRIIGRGPLLGNTIGRQALEQSL